MASSLAEAKEMLSASRAHPGQVAQVVPSPFTLDADSTVLEILNSGRIGDIREVFIDHSTGAYVDPDAPLTWRQDPAYSGHNMLTLGIYHEIIQRWFPDRMEVIRAVGEVFTRERVHWESGRRVPVELPDCLHVLGRMERGALLNYHFSGMEPGPGRNEIKLAGSLGTLRLDVGKGDLFLSETDGMEQPVDIPPGKRRGWRVEADFIESIRTGKPVERTSFAEGVRYMEFTDAVYDSLAG
jgi:predicted dehydrogenase